MAMLRCPNCSDEFQPEDGSEGFVFCPACGTNVTKALDATEGYAEDGETSVQRESSFGHSSGDTFVGDQTGSPVPAGSKLEIIEETADSLVVLIPAGGKRANSIGWFAIIWNAITLAVGGVFVFAGFQDGDFDLVAMLFVLGVLSLFQLIGLVMIYAWVRMTFTHTILAIRPDRIDVQYTLFNRSWIDGCDLNETSKADLIEVYRENDRPVNCVGVNGILDGTEKTVKFATALNASEKAWLKSRIDAFLRQPAHPLGDQLAQFGFSLAEANTSAIEPIAPSDLPPDSGIIIESARPGELSLSLPIVEYPFVRWGISLVIVGWELIWTAGVLGALLLGAQEGGAPIALIVGGFMLLGSLIPLLVVLFVLFGKLFIHIDRSEISVRCRWIRTVWSKSMPTEEVTGVGLASSTSRAKGRQSNAGTSFPVCVVTSHETAFPLTLLQRKKTAKEVAGLVTYQLHQFGISVNDE